MKITDPQVIRQGERDLIDSVQEDLDLDTVREILKERMSVAALSSKGGQIVVHDNQIAFRLDFEINLSGSLLFDREGNFIDEADALDSDPEAPVSPLIQDRESQGEDLYGAGHGDLEDDIDDDLMDDDITENSMDLEEEDDLSVDLPDYGIDVQAEEEDATPEPEDDGMGELDDELELAAEELAMEDLDEEEEDFLDDEAIDLEEEADDEDFQAIMDEEDEDNPFADDDSQDLDDDINDILKESREFWEQKKES